MKKDAIDLSKALTEEIHSLQEDLRVHILSEPDPLEVINQEEGYDYFWAAIDESHPQSWVAMQRYGWRLAEKVGSKATNPYGKTRFNELILMRRPKSITDEQRKLRSERVAKYIRSAERDMSDLQERAERLVRDGVSEKTIIV